MTITANIDILSNRPIERGYAVVTVDEGRLWLFGVYPDEYSAQAAVDEFPESRFMVEVAK